MTPQVNIKEESELRDQYKLLLQRPLLYLMLLTQFPQLLFNLFPVRYHRDSLIGLFHQPLSNPHLVIQYLHQPQLIREFQMH